jgi:hypothetical protein
MRSPGFTPMVVRPDASRATRSMTSIHEALSTGVAPFYVFLLRRPLGSFHFGSLNSSVYLIGAAYLAGFTQKSPLSQFGFHEQMMDMERIGLIDTMMLGFSGASIGSQHC